MRGPGRRRAGEDNVRLRQRVANLTDDLAWYRGRLKTVTARCRALQAQGEIVAGERLLDQQLIHRQTAQLMERDSLIEELRRQLKTASDDTAEMPIVTAAEPELATTP